MALLLCLMLLLQHSQGPSLDSALPLINNNNITNNGPSTINQSTMPLPSNVDNNDTTNDGPPIINKTIELDKGRDVFTNERHSPTPLPVPSQPMGPSFTDTFRPSLTVIVGLLSSMLGLSFLVLLYAKHCKRIPMSVYEEERDMPSLRYHLNYYHHYEARGAGGSSGRAPDNARTDSGISPYVVESLPTFPFSALKGMKDGLECAVCLSRYNNADVLRLLPTCKHAFHLACIDLWLLHHSTCPLCRRRVDNDNDNDHDLGSISISHSQELEDFFSRYKLWGGRGHEDSDSARIPSSAWEHWGQISEVGGQSARVSAPPGEPSAWSRIGVPVQHSSLVAGDSARTLELGVNWTHMSAPAPPRSLAPVPIMMGGDGQLLPGVSTLDSNSSPFSKLGRHSSRGLLRSAATHSARALGPDGQLARVPASQCTDIPMVEMPTLEFYLQREVEGVDDDENNGGVSIWCNGGSNSWRKLDDDGVCAEPGSAKKNHMDDGALVVEGLGKVPKEGSMQRWVVTKGMVMMRRRRMNESWRKGGDKYYDEEVMKRLRHRINIIPHFSSHTIHHHHHHHHHDTHCNDDDDDDDDDVDGCHDTLTMGHHHYGHDVKPCTRNVTTRCFSEISRRDQIGSL